MTDIELELYHHGIKGMKWGRRRYQNKDGSLTPAGKKKAREDSNKKQLTREQKAAVKLGVAATATALTLYGTYKVAKFAGRKAADNFFLANGGNIVHPNRGYMLARRNQIAGLANLRGSSVSNGVKAVGYSVVAAGLATFGAVEARNLRKESNATPSTKK